MSLVLKTEQRKKENKTGAAPIDPNMKVKEKEMLGGEGKQVQHCNSCDYVIKQKGKRAKGKKNRNRGFSCRIP